MHFFIRLWRVARNLFPFWRLLFMAWTTPPTKAANDDWTASIWNTYVRDNLTYLFSGRPIGQVHYVGAADKTSSSTSWADVDSTNIKVTLTINSGRARVFASFRGSADNTASSAAEFDLAYDGTRLGDSTHGLARTSQNTTHFFAIEAIATGLSVGSHTFTLQFRNVTGGAVTTVSNNGFPVNLVVEEI